MASLYLHIGSNKTATTTLQNRLANSESVLATGKLLYPRTGRSQVGAHHVLAAHFVSFPPKEFQPQQSFEEMMTALDAECSAAPNLDVVLSSEMLLHFRHLKVERMTSLLQRFDTVKVIAYLRRQDQFLPSFYSSRINNGKALEAFDAFCDNYPIDWLSDLRGWASLVGRDQLTVRPFDKQFWHAGDFVEDFLQQLDHSVDAGDLTQSPPLNESLSLEVMQVLQAIGGGDQIDNPAEFQRFTSEAVGAVREIKRSTLMTESIYRGIASRYADQNATIATEFLTEDCREALVFDATYTPPAPPYEPLSADEIARVLAQLWQRQLKLREKLRSAELIRIEKTGELRRQRDELLERHRRLREGDPVERGGSRWRRALKALLKP